MARFCLQTGCPEVVDAKVSWCGEHDPNRDRPAWQGSSSARSRSNGWAWSRLRQRVLRRDGYRCVKCKAQGNEVDHIIPAARCLELGISAHDLANLQTLCVKCHKAKTEADRLEGMRLSREIKKGRSR